MCKEYSDIDGKDVEKVVEKRARLSRITTIRPGFLATFGWRFDGTLLETHSVSFGQSTSFYIVNQ
jgi:hypothetical protein